MRWTRPPRWADRIVKRFAFLPITIKGEARWLENVYLAQTYNPVAGWMNLAFVRKEDYRGQSKWKKETRKMKK